MSQTCFTLIYITLLSVEFLTLYTLTILNISSVLKNREKMPSIFSSWVTEESYQKSIKYSIKKEHFSIIRLIFSTVLTLTILYSGILGWIENSLTNYMQNSILLGLSYIGVFSIILGLFDLPLSIYSTFVIEEEFGFNKMSIKSYLGDLVKQVVLTTILGGIILFALFLFMDKTGNLWWVWSSAFFILFQLLLVLIYPNFIAPIFNKFSPLESGELKEQLETMAEKADFNLKGIFVMDGSKRSGHSNAYFTGIGSSKRIVLFDTLIESLTVNELCGVMAHEIGHWKKGHIRKRLTLSFIQVPLTFFILSLALKFTTLYRAFNIEPYSYHGLFVIAMLIGGTFTFYFTPISNYFSRKHEFEADNYANYLQGESESLINALFKLSKNNLSNLTPDKNYSAFHYSHPPTAERVNRLNELNLKS